MREVVDRSIVSYLVLCLGVVQELLGFACSEVQQWWYDKQSVLRMSSLSAVWCCVRVR